MKNFMLMLAGCLSACGPNASHSEAGGAPVDQHAAALTAEPYACVTMRAPNHTDTVTFSAPATVNVAGTMRADFIGTFKEHSQEQAADVTVTFSGENATPGAGSSARQAAVKLKELDPCNLIYVAYNVNPFVDERAGQDQISIKVKRNDLAHTSSECRADGYSVLKAINVPAHQAVGTDYAGTVRIKATVKAPTSGGTYNICLSVWGNASGTLTSIISGQCYNLHGAPLNDQVWPTWGGIVGMRTDNVNASATWSTPGVLNAEIERDDPRWADHCQTQVPGGGE